MTEGGEGARIELDAARATGLSSAPVYAPPTIRPGSIAQDPIEPVSEIPDPSVRIDAIIAESRKAHIDHLLESCSVKDWDVAEAKATGSKVLTGRFVDDNARMCSCYCAIEFATTNDPEVFAAASDPDNASFVDLHAAAFPQATKEELVFLWPPAEYTERIGKQVLWQCLKVREGRRSSACGWKNHLSDIIERLPDAYFQRNPKVVSQFFCKGLDVVLDLHVDDGNGSGRANCVMNMLDAFCERIVSKVGPMMFVGDTIEYVSAARIKTESEERDQGYVDGFLPYADEVTQGMTCTDSTCVSCEIYRTPGGGSIVMDAVCRMHSHSNGLDHPDLSSGESEIIGMSEGPRHAICVTDTLFFPRFGDLQIEKCTDAIVARACLPRLGRGRMKHLDVRLCWLQLHQKIGVFICTKVPCVDNLAEV